MKGNKTILYFYPKDDTPGCTIEACEFRDSNEELQNLNAPDMLDILPLGALCKKGPEFAKKAATKRAVGNHKKADGWMGISIDRDVKSDYVDEYEIIIGKECTNIKDLNKSKVLIINKDKTPLIGTFLVSKDVEFILNGSKITVSVNDL